MREIPFVDLRKQYNANRFEINQKIKEVLSSGEFILGQETEKFEQEFARFCDVKYAVGVDSGLSALELGMRALGIGEGDEVLVPVNSFIASASSISFVGAKPVFVDCEPDSFNIDLDQAEKLISHNTKALMLVHLCGRMANVKKARALAKRYNLLLLEDACQAHGAELNGKRAGAFGDIAAFSFYPGKNLGAYGDGGMLTTNNRDVVEKIKLLRHYGQKKKNIHVLLGWNKRLDNLQAAVLRVKLRKLQAWNRRRILNAKLYNNMLSQLPITTPQLSKKNECVFHLYVIRVKKRDALAKYLASQGIKIGIHYPTPIHLQKAYAHLGYKMGNFPVAEKLSKEILSLPMFPELKKSEIEYICNKITNFYSHK